MAVEDPVAEPEPLVPPQAADDGAGWRADKQGRQYIPRRNGKPGIIYRTGEETIEQALERDAKPRDQRPRRKTKRPKMPEPPKRVDLKELELALAEALKAPAMPCAMFGDEWAANHFTTSGPYLARNLILASQHNPWLLRKLEDAATGQDAAMKLVTLVGVGGALFAYAVPPIVWWFKLPVPEKSREMFGIPPPRDHEPPRAPAEPPAPMAAAA